MFVYEVMQLLKDVVCPVCTKKASLENGSPFREFNVYDLQWDCTNSDCNVFYDTMNAHFNSFEEGEINELELKTWLDDFRARSANSEG